jgi:hypothetical protein
VGGEGSRVGRDDGWKEKRESVSMFAFLKLFFFSLCFASCAVRWIL